MRSRKNFRTCSRMGSRMGSKTTGRKPDGSRPSFRHGHRPADRRRAHRRRPRHVVGSIPAVVLGQFAGLRRADPFRRVRGAFHPAGHSLLYSGLGFHDHGRRRATDHSLFHCLCRTFAGRPRHCGRLRVHAVRGALGLLSRDRGGHWLHRHRGHAPSRLFQGIRRRGHLQRRHSRDFDPALHCHGGLCGGRRSVGRPHVHGGRHSGPRGRYHADGHDLYHRQGQGPPERGMERLARDLGLWQGRGLGPFPHRDHPGRHLRRHLYPHRGRRRRRGLSFLISTFVIATWGP